MVVTLVAVLASLTAYIPHLYMNVAHSHLYVKQWKPSVANGHVVSFAQKMNVFENAQLQLTHKTCVGLFTPSKHVAYIIHHRNGTHYVASMLSSSTNAITINDLRSLRRWFSRAHPNLEMLRGDLLTDNIQRDMWTMSDLDS